MHVPHGISRCPSVAGAVVWLLAAGALLAFAGSRAFAQPPAGRVKIASGSVFIVRPDGAAPARVGDLVYEADTLRTGRDGHLGITLKDDTRLSLAPGSEVRLDRFVYAPAEGRLGFVLDVVRGIVAFVSGRIAKLAPDAVRLKTPSAIVGVRGTTLILRVEPASESGTAAWSPHRDRTAGEISRR